MQQLDERILEVAECKRFVSPASLQSEFPHLSASRSRINERCEMLEAVGFLAPIVQGTDHYHLTTWGKLYLDGELDAEYTPA
jgi:hypothetical protein